MAVVIAALYDIHANLPALEAVLAELNSAHADSIVVGGDVLPGPMPSETLARLLAVNLPVHFIRGNGDREVLARMDGTESDWFRMAAETRRTPVRWSAEQLSQQHKELLAGWPATCRLHVQGLGEVLFCHATHRNDIDIFIRMTSSERLIPIFERVDAPVVVCGHTHMPFDRMVGTVRVVNPGSVGMPYGKPGAYWLMLGPGVELRYAAYDLINAAARVRATAYPQAEHFAAQSVLKPPSEEETLALFARAELTP